VRVLYLAGPDVFLPDAKEIGAKKRTICRECGFEGLFPLDNEALKPGSSPEAEAIFKANCALMDKADAGVVNLTPFRGVSADAGTAFELGYLFAKKKPVFGYTNTTAPYLARVAQSGPLAPLEGRWADARGHAVEDFGLAENLMLVRAIEDSGGALTAVHEAAGPDAPDALAAFSAFRACLGAVRDYEQKLRRMAQIQKSP